MRTNSAFSGTRVRFQRVHDARFFGGWTVWFDGSNIVVRVGLNPAFEVGEVFFFQIYGSEKCSLFPAECVGADRDHAKFKVMKRPRQVENSEDVRLYNTNVQCTIDGEFGRQRVEVVDISPKGVGIHMSKESAKGDVVTLHLETENGPVTAIGTVRNCRPCSSGYGFRVGFVLSISDRSMQGRWKNQFFDVA